MRSLKIDAERNVALHSESRPFVFQIYIVLYLSVPGSHKPIVILFKVIID